MADIVTRQAWVELPSDEDAYGERTKGGQYDFGFPLGMSKLLMAHPRIAQTFGPIFHEIMFSPDGALTRQEREMVAGVAASAQDCYY